LILWASRNSVNISSELSINDLIKTLLAYNINRPTNGNDVIKFLNNLLIFNIAGLDTKKILPISNIIIMPSIMARGGGVLGAIEVTSVGLGPVPTEFS